MKGFYTITSTALRKATFGLRTQDERKKESDRHKVKQEERLERKVLGGAEREV